MRGLFEFVQRAVSMNPVASSITKSLDKKRELAYLRAGGGSSKNYQSAKAHSKSSMADRPVSGKAAVKQPVGERIPPPPSSRVGYGLPPSRTTSPLSSGRRGHR